MSEPRFSGSKLRDARKAVGVSRVRLAHELNLDIGPETVRNYEIGLYTPNINTLIRICAILNVKLKDLLDA